METFLYLILIVLASSFIAGLLLIIMVKKYYWGPTGVPPKQRYQDKVPNEKSENSSQPSSNEKRKISND